MIVKMKTKTKRKRKVKVKVKVKMNRFCFSFFSFFFFFSPLFLLKKCLKGSTGATTVSRSSSYQCQPVSAQTPSRPVPAVRGNSWNSLRRMITRLTLSIPKKTTTGTKKPKKDHPPHLHLHHHHSVAVVGFP